MPHLQEGRESLDQDFDLAQDQPDYPADGSEIGGWISESYVERGIEAHVHVLVCLDGENKQYCAAFHRADPRLDVFGNLTDGSPSIRRVGGEVRALVLVGVAELVEQGKRV